MWDILVLLDNHMPRTYVPCAVCQLTPDLVLTPENELLLQCSSLCHSPDSFCLLSYMATCYNTSVPCLCPRGKIARFRKIRLSVKLEFQISSNNASHTIFGSYLHYTVALSLPDCPGFPEEDVH